MSGAPLVLCCNDRVSKGQEASSLRAKASRGFPTAGNLFTARPMPRAVGHGREPRAKGGRARPAVAEAKMGGP
eukprot:7883082-Alexandrium_andersonii.AAC.1